MAISDPAIPEMKNSAAEPGVVFEMVFGIPGKTSPKVRSLFITIFCVQPSSGKDSKIKKLIEIINFLISIGHITKDNY